MLEKVPEARLLIIGEGSQRETLEAQAEGLGLLGHECNADECVGTRGARPEAKILFTGLRDDIPAVTAALDVAVLPSYREAQGLAILEAMALRRPVVATQVGGVPEMIDNGRNGLLVPPRDPEALANAIVRLLTDHPLADMLARAGHDFVHANFSVEHMVRAVSAIYEEGAAVVSQRSGATEPPLDVNAMMPLRVRAHRSRRLRARRVTPTPEPLTKAPSRSYCRPTASSAHATTLLAPPAW